MVELTLTALIKAIILHWGRGSSSGDKQPETKQKSSKFKMHQPPSLFPSDLNNYRPISVISVIAGHGLGILWPLGGAFVMLIVNVDCVLANDYKVQDKEANLKTTDKLPLLFAV